jgi:hypothetical protein
MTDSEAIAHLRQLIDDWQSGLLHPDDAMEFIGQILASAAICDDEAVQDHGER